LTLKYPIEHGIVTNWDDMEISGTTLSTTNNKQQQTTNNNNKQPWETVKFRRSLLTTVLACARLDLLGMMLLVRSSLLLSVALVTLV